MSNSTLTTFWIVPNERHGPLGYGVTAFSLSDAFSIIQLAGYKLPDDRSKFRISQDVKVADLDQRHIVPNMGPIVVRGLWYPFSKVGM